MAGQVSVVQAAIYQGYAAAASVLGGPCTVFRSPGGAVSPLGNAIGTAQAMFDTDPQFRMRNPAKFGQIDWFAGFDATTAKVNDVLVDATGRTFFLASLEPLKAPKVVHCNRTLSISRPTPTGRGGGKQNYGGNVAAERPPVMTGWPALVLQGTKGEKSQSGLPQDSRMPWLNVVLPAIPGVLIQTDDMATDELGQSYEISSCELTDLGWRLTMDLAQT